MVSAPTGKSYRGAQPRPGPALRSSLRRLQRPGRGLRSAGSCSQVGAGRISFQWRVKSRVHPVCIGSSASAPTSGAM